jgi:Family of unknown function (DUF6152)
MKRFVTATFLLVGIFSAFAAYAHHSAAGIDRGKQVMIEGIVKQFKWGNPHSWLDVEVPNAKGGVDLWSLEMTSPAFLVRAGWKSTSIKAGEKVKVVATPFRNGDPGGLFISVTLPDGKTLGTQALPAAPAAAQPATK